MKLLRLPGYCFPEQVSSLRLDEDLNEELSKNEIIQEFFVPVPSRGISDEDKQKYKKLKFETRYGGKVVIHRFSVMEERRNPLLRAIRYLLINVKQYRLGIKAKDVDIVYGTSTPPTQGLTCAKIAKKLSKKYNRHVPFIYNLQDVFPDSLVKTGLTKEGSLLWKIGRKIENKTYASADKIIVISEDFKRNIMAKGVPEEKIEVVYNWVDTEKIKPVERKDNKLFDEYNINRSDFAVVYAGNFGVSQGIKVVVDAAELLKNHSDIKFVLFGGGAEYEEIKKYAESLGLENVMINPLLPGDRISEVYSLGDVNLITCKKGFGECAFPSKTWSIMACNSFIIASYDKVSELADVIEKSGVGQVVEPENPTDLAKMILQAKENRKQVNGRDYLKQFADKNTCLRKYAGIFNGVLASNTRKEII